MIFTRRAVMGLPWLAASWAAGAQPTPSKPVPARPSTSAQSIPSQANLADTSIFAADSQPSSLILAQTLASRLGADNFAALASPDLAHSIAAVTNRDENNLAILPSTALAALDSQGSATAGSIRFIARISVMEVHLLASERISSMTQLAGQKVNVGLLGGQGQVTASLLLERSGVQVEPVYSADEVALASLIHRQLAAMIFLATKPSRLLFKVNLSDGVHLLPVLEATSGGRPTGGFLTRIDAEDYPLLSGAESGAGQSIATIGVPLVLACYDWPVASRQFITFARVADLLSQREPGLRGFSMTAVVPGWQRFGPVADWLKNGGSINEIAAASQRAAAPQSIDYHKLYLQFLEWRKHHQ
jgi:hypothetical protein